MFSRVFAAVSAVVFLAAAPEGCAPPGSTPGKSCATEVHEPVVSPDHPESIEAISRSECDFAPESHRVTLTIEEQLPGGAWFETEDNGLSSRTICNEIPSPGHDTSCVRLVPCLDGTYRARVEVYGYGENYRGVEDSFYWETTSFVVEIRCPA